MRADNVPPDFYGDILSNTNYIKRRNDKYYTVKINANSQFVFLTIENRNSKMNEILIKE